ncbi:MAG: diguanylate cyclase, partial [Gammaproteobacteria bacterium]|nr:diguanylate cyclase [Gammaproteobacteria bacterium]
MNENKDKHEHSSTFVSAKASPWAAMAIWTMSIVASFIWNDNQVRSLIMEQANSELRASFFKDLTFRQWATRHGGVYVPVTEDIQPDPYIDYIPERDVVTPSGRVLTLINPALMVRMFNEIASANSETQGNISSLRPINPINKPDAWETRALEVFENSNEGIEEITEISSIGGEPYLRLIHAMKMAEKCLKCHEHQGYKVGDIAGGVSVSVPLNKLDQAAQEEIIKIGFGHVVLWMFGVVGIVYGSKRLNKGISESNQAYLALGESETRTSSILGASLDAIITIDQYDVITDWNKHAEEMFGWKAKEVLGKELTNFIVPVAYRQRHINGIKAFIETGAGPELNKRRNVYAMKKNGVEFPVEITIASITVSGKQGFSAFIRDISEQKKAAEQINNDYHSQRVISAVLEISTQPITFKEKLERSLEAILSTPWLVLKGTGAIFVVDENSDKLLMAAQSGVSKIIQDRCSEVKFGECLCGRAAKNQEVTFSSCLDKRHSEYYEDMADHGHYCLPIKSEDTLMGVLNLYLNHGHKRCEEEIRFLTMIANTLGNIFRQHENEEKLEYFAYYDELTGLPNRTLFIDRLDQCIKRKKRDVSYLFAVLFLDLDRFKNINDSLGHMVGDQVLNKVAERLKKCIREIDTVSRLGGDEFAIIIDDIDDISDAFHTASRIHHELISPLELGRHEVFTSTSIGIVLSNLAYETHSEVLRDVDTAMYRAKQKGNGHTEAFDEKMHAQAVKALRIETELRRAVERNEFEIYYQPIISVVEGRIIGFESLLRWNSPERGMVPPDDFIPIAEETGLINEIGIWVLQESCRQMKVWNEQYPEYSTLYISVNLSPVQFMQKDFIAQIDSQLNSISFDTRNLRLEITESIL